MGRKHAGVGEFRRPCDDGGWCVEVALADTVSVRDSKAGQDGPVLVFSRTEWSEFITAVKAGKFDLG